MELGIKRFEYDTYSVCSILSISCVQISLFKTEYMTVSILGGCNGLASEEVH